MLANRQTLGWSRASGVRVEGPRFRVKVQGFRVQGLGFRVRGFRVQGLGFRV